MDYQTPTQEKVNYGAKAGQVIAGNLARGGDGKFAAAGDGAAAKTAVTKQDIARRKLAKQQHKTAKFKAGKIDKPEPKKKAAAPPKKTKQELAQDAIKELPQDAAQKLLDYGEAKDKKAFDFGEELTKSLLDQGLLEEDIDGALKLTGDGRAVILELRKQKREAPLPAGESVREALIRFLEVGARNSRTDQQRIQAMHDTAVELGARCNHDNAPGVLSEYGVKEAVTAEAWTGASAKGKRCYQSLIVKGYPKEKAIAICRASLKEEKAQEAAPIKYRGLDFTPPEAVQKAALRGLALRKQYGRGGLDTQQAGKQGIGSGVARARDLASGKAVSPDTVRRMAAFFARHESNKDTPPEEGNGRIAWLLWGGDAGRAWADGLTARMDAADKKAEAIRRGLEAQAEQADTAEKRQMATAALKKAGFDDKAIAEILRLSFGKSSESFKALPLKAKKAFFGKLTAGKVPGKTPYRQDPKTGKRKPPFGSKDDLADYFAQKDAERGVTRIKPTGRAKRGQGPEYAARRAIDSKINTNARNASKLQNRIDNFRGTKAGNWNITQAKARLGELRKAISAATAIVDGPGDWGFKKELVDGIFAYTSAIT